MNFLGWVAASLVTSARSRTSIDSFFDRGKHLNAANTSTSTPLTKIISIVRLQKHIKIQWNNADGWNVALRGIIIVLGAQHVQWAYYPAGPRQERPQNRQLRSQRRMELLWRLTDVREQNAGMHEMLSINA
jgi:hypothetical protein